jgi:hypothetical protein
VLFAKLLDAVGLDSRYGAYVDHLPAISLATVNLMSWMGLHRVRRGAIVGHLALYEMTSSVPSRRYGDALRRLGFGEDATDFFDEHVEADAIHESVASVDLAGGLVRQDPAMARDILWGARALVALEGRWATWLLGAWEDGRSSLRVRSACPSPPEPRRDVPAYAGHGLAELRPHQGAGARHLRPHPGRLAEHVRGDRRRARRPRPARRLRARDPRRARRAAVPWHRVIAEDGGTGGGAAGERRRARLADDGVVVHEGRVADLDARFVHVALDADHRRWPSTPLERSPAG